MHACYRVEEGLVQLRGNAEQAAEFRGFVTKKRVVGDEFPATLNASKPRKNGEPPKSWKTSKTRLCFQLHLHPCLGVCWQLTSFMSWPVSLLRFSGMQNRSPQHRHHYHLRSVRLSMKLVRIRFRGEPKHESVAIVWPEYGRERFQV
jgi:hypothetical protein